MTMNEFCRASGLKVNLENSKAICSKGVSKAKLVRISAISNIHFTDRFKSYPGIPLVHGRVRKEDFNFVMDKLTRKLSTWKTKLLNRAGRITLAKSVLTSLPLYGMHTLRFPQAVCNDIDSIVRRFIWKGNEGKGIHLVKWDTVTLPRSHGGLGVCQAREANISLLGKLVWDTMHRPDKLWVQLVRDKYMDGQGRFDLFSSSATASYGWRSISKLASALKKGMVWRIGNGQEVSLWNDTWLDRGPLRDLLEEVPPALTNLKVADIIQDKEWNLPLLDELGIGNVKQYISSIPINEVGEITDQVMWKHTANGIYSAMSGYRGSLLAVTLIPWK